MLKISGKSGCKLKPIFKDERLFIRKVSSGISYNNRLKLQVDKQFQFSKSERFKDFFIVPRIFDEGYTSSSLYYFDMEFINAEKFSDYFSRISIDGAKNFINKIINYLENSFQESSYSSLDILVVERKLQEISEKMSANNKLSGDLINNILNYLGNNIPNSKLPQNICHGDLTFSNLLFGKNGAVYTFDFLDSFIESPIIDLVKIRQDTKFHWSLIIDEKLDSHKKLRVLQILKYFDSEILNYLNEKGEHLIQWYEYLEIFNFVRILPYVKIERELNFLKSNITKLITKR